VRLSYTRVHSIQAATKSRQLDERRRTATRGPKRVVFERFIVWWAEASSCATDDFYQANPIFRGIAFLRRRIEEKKSTKAYKELGHRRTSLPLNPNVNLDRALSIWHGLRRNKTTQGIKGRQSCESSLLRLRASSISLHKPVNHSRMEISSRQGS